MTKLILTDVDEVVLDWGTHFAEWYLKTYSLFGGVAPKQDFLGAYNIEEWIGCDIETTRKLIEMFNQCKDHFPNIRPYDHALEYIPRLKREGYSFVAITACSDDDWSHDARRANLNRYFPGVFDTVHCVGLSKSKVPYLERYKPTWWVDDKFKHAEAGGKLGHKAFLMNQRHNEMNIPKYSKRVNSWKDIYECIVDDNCYRLGWMA